MKTQNALEPIGLHYAFLPSMEWDLAPGQIVVSTDERAVVQNKLLFSIRNPLGHPVVNFENPDQLTPQSDLPPITAGQQWPKPVDRLYLRFPWCSKPPVQCSGMLTTTGYSENVNCYPHENTREKWYTTRMSDPNLGIYWILFPRERAVNIDAGESIQFVVEGIITFINPNTHSEIYIKPNVAGYESSDEAVATVYLTDPPPQIKLRALTDNVLAGTDVSLVWSTLNAKRCRLSPVDGGEKDVPPQAPEGFTVRPLRTTTYKLEAFSPLGNSTSTSVTVNVRPVAIKSFTAEPASGVRVGDTVTLRWTTESAVSCEVTYIGEVCTDARNCGSGSNQVLPAIYTEYTLKAAGQDGPRERSVAVFPLPLGWSQPAESAPWKTFARPVTLMFAIQDGPAEMWLFAGGTGTANNPVFSSKNGEVWNPRNNNAPFSLRGNSGGAVFQKKMWLLGGEGVAGKLNDVWASADGVTWENIRPAAKIWSARAGFGCAAFKDKLWVMGGTGADGKLLRDVWSTTDGVNWQQEADARWSARAEFGVTIFQDRLWVLGGKVEGGSATNAVWSSVDGLQWNQEADGQWPARSNPSVQAIRKRLYLFGGASAAGEGLTTFYYLENGKWFNIAGPAWKDARRNLASIQYQEALWLLGGELSSGAANRQVWVYAPLLT
jgi:hypothetical protein